MITIIYLNKSSLREDILNIPYVPKKYNLGRRPSFNQREPFGFLRGIPNILQ
jgi:hypothetical protein